MQLLQQEAVELPLAFGLLVVQQRTILTGSPTHPGQGDTRHYSAVIILPLNVNIK